MFYRKDAVSMAVLGLLACAGVAVADSEVSSKGLSLSPSAITAAEAAAERTPLMGALDKAGAASSLDQLGLNITGHVQVGYYANLRNNQGSKRSDTTSITRPSPFTENVGHHAALNQVAVMISRNVASDKFDVGGAIEAIFGTDANYIKSNGMEILTEGDNPGEVPNFDIFQMYVDVNVPVGNGLKIRVGRFATLLGYEYVNPTLNPFYSHSYLFNNVAFSQTGILAFYTINDQWSVTGGFTRGWDQFTEDNNDNGIDFLGQVAYKHSDTITAYLTTSVGPQNANDNSHYRVTINPIIVWKATEALTIGVEGLYNYDGGKNGSGPELTHAYGDNWGVAVYASYAINEYMALNLRGEKFHEYTLDGTTNYYEGTIGLTITPFPKDGLLKNLMIRPEFRYDWSEDSVFATGNRTFQDRFGAGLDVIFKF
jgi:hypothetical protein